MLSSKRLSQIQVGHISTVIIDDYILICGLRVNLTANIIGNIKGHKFLWEQISGDTAGITYLTPMNGLLLDFAIEIPPAIRDDKQFRLWIDKGTRREQYYDVWVWSSFVDYYKSNVTRDIGVNNFNTTFQTTALSDITAVCGFADHYYTNLENLDNTPSLFLYWNDPNTAGATQLLNYFIEYYDSTNGSWNIFKHSVSSFLDTTIQPNTIYRVGANYYNIKTSQLTQLFSNNVSYNSNDTRWYNNDVFINEYYNAHSNNFNLSNDLNEVTGYSVYSVVNYSNVELYESWQSKFVSVNDTSIVSSYVNYDVINLVVIPSQDNATYYTMPTTNNNINNNNVVTNYTNYTNVNIGG